MKNTLKGLFLAAYFLLLFIASASVLTYIEKLILFGIRPEIFCVDNLSFLKLPLTITLTFCAHIIILKLYKRFFEKTKISFNKTQRSVLISCLVLSVALSVYSLSANKTEFYSDGNIKEYDYSGRVSSVKTVDETEKVELKVEKTYFVNRRGSSIDCSIVFSLFFPDGEIFELDDTYFRDVDAMKAMKALADDKLVIIHSREEAGEMIGAADYELYKTYCELLPQEYDTEEDGDYHSYYETFEGTTHYEFGMGGHTIYE